jgi:type I restriction enzyme S subunit
MAFEMKKLNDVCRLINGRAYKKPEMLAEGKYPLLRVGNFFSNRAWYYSDLELNEDKYCDNGDLLYAWSASFGPRIWDGGKVIYHYHIWKIEINEELVDKGYLFHLLDWDTEQIKAEQGTGSTMIHVTKGSMESRSLPFPPTPEQKRIVAILDQAFADIGQARATTEKNLKNARELFESYLQQVFSQRGEGWVESELFEHVKFIDYRGKTPKKTKQGLRLITAKNVRMGYLKVEPQEFVAPESYESWMTRGIPQKGDVLFTTEAPLANVAQLDTDEKTVFAQRIITMQPDQNILNSTFLKYMLMSQPIQQLIHDKGTGATCTGIKASLLKKIPITYPSDMNEQVEYVDVLDSLTDKVKLLESIYIQKLSALDNLKKSILHKAFSGELTETLEVDTNKGALA